MESSSVITPEDVMECLMNDGTIDAMRLKIINQLKSNEELKNKTIKMAEQSKVLNTPGAEKQTKRELFDALRQELDFGAEKSEFLQLLALRAVNIHDAQIEILSGRRSDVQHPSLVVSGALWMFDDLTSVLEKASKSVWDLILDSNGLGKEINQTVESVFCRLSGSEPPFIPPNIETPPERRIEKEKEKGKGKESARDHDKLSSGSASKKRKAERKSSEGGHEEAGNGPTNNPPPDLPDDSRDSLTTQT